MKSEIKLMSRSVNALAYELPETVWKEVNKNWVAVLGRIEKDTSATLTKEKYPIPQPMATDETLIGLYARTAPDVPDWFDDKPQVKDKLRNQSEYRECNSKNSEIRYFQWRLYYANKMIELLNKK